MFLSELPAPQTPAALYVVSTFGRTPCGTNVVEAMNVAELQVDENVRRATVYREGEKEPIARYVWDPERHEVREEFRPGSHYEALGPVFPDDGFDDDDDGDGFDLDDDLPDDEGESPYPVEDVDPWDD